MIAALMSKHVSAAKNWCHFCGERTRNSVNVWWAENAEKDTLLGAKMADHAGRYVRICFKCGERICRISKGIEENDPRLGPKAV